MNASKLKATPIFSLLFIFFLFSIGSTTLPAQGPAIDPAAQEILKQMTDYLGGLKQFSVHTQNSLEDILSNGHRVDLNVSAEVIVSRPNKLRAERHGDLVNQLFFYNGRTLSLYNPTYNVYATEPVPDTFEGLFKHMYQTLGFGVPVSDLIYPNAFQLLMEDLSFATVIGKTYIDGKKCDHLLFSRPDVDFQLWVSDGSEPLPLKYVITDTTTDRNLSVSTLMTDWNVKPAVDESTFSFTAPEGSEKIDFMPF